MDKLIISLPLVSVHDYTNEQLMFVYARSARNAGYQLAVPARLKFTWYIKNKRQDSDNIIFQRKFILYGMVNADVLLDNGWQYVLDFSDYLYVEHKDERIEIEVE